MVIAIPLNMNKRLIKAGVSKLLDSNIQSRRGRKALRDADSSALYPLARNYTAQNLKTALRLQKIAEPHRVEHAHCVALRQQLWYEYGAFIAAAASQEDIHLDSFLLKIKQ